MKRQRRSSPSAASGRISVRWKFIYYGLIISCIPGIFLSLFFVNNIRSSSIQAEQERYASAAINISEAFFHDVQSMQTVAALMTSETRLSDKEMGVSVANNLQAMKMLRSFKNMLPVAADCGYYTQITPDEIYSSQAIWKRPLFCRYVFTDEKAFEEAMLCLERVNFTPWSEADNSCVCVIPLSFSDNSEPSRIAFFQLSANSILNRFDMFMGGLEECRLAAIWDDEDRLIFYNSACGLPKETVEGLRTDENKTGMHNDLYFCRGESINYSALICSPYSRYYAQIHSFSASIKLVLLIDLLLCIMLAGSFAWVNYRPLAQLISSMDVHLDNANGYEYDVIRNQYARSERQKQLLASQYAESERMLFGSVAEKLLNGFNLNPSEQLLLSERFHRQGGYYFAAIAPLPADGAGMKSSVPEMAGGTVHPVEMTADGFLVYLCWVEDKNSYYPAAKSILKQEGEALSVGSMGESMAHIHTSYLEALLAFNRGGESKLVFFESVCSQEERPSLDSKSLNIMQLVRLLKNGDESALDELNAVFDSVIIGEGSMAYKRYQCFRLVEKLKESMNKLDIHMDDETAASFMSAANPELIRQGCIQYLTAMLEQIRIDSAAQNKSAADGMLRFIEEYMDDSALNLPMVADHAHISESLANKLIRETTGLNLQEYLRKRRLETAKELLICSNEPIAQIAEDVGFNSCSYFIRVFKAEEGVTPSAFRTLNAAGQTPEA